MRDGGDLPGERERTRAHLQHHIGSDVIAVVLGHSWYLGTNSVVKLASTKDFFFTKYQTFGHQGGDGITSYAMLALRSGLFSFSR